MQRSEMTNQYIESSHQAIEAAYKEARFWIGCRLILKKPLFRYMPGMPCVVMCVGDFGEGPLLWIVSDDRRAIEIVQMELADVRDYFEQR